jgi:hypothetical protein
MENEEENYDPYCKVCGGCGEDGCCSASICKQDPNGEYCKSYLLELKFGYGMYKFLLDLVCDDPKYKDQIDEKWDSFYDQIFGETPSEE